MEASKPTQPEEAAGAAEEGAEGEEDCSADFKPLVQLSEVESVSGEEAEAQLCDLCAPAPCLVKPDLVNLLKTRKLGSG